MNKAIFFDRDGCLIVDKHYLSDPNGVEFFPDTIAALKLLAHQYDFFMVTNQSGIGRGMFTLEDMERVHERLDEMLSDAGVPLKAIAFCPHLPSDNCDCRKPSPKLVNTLCHDFGIDPAASFFVGDKLSDAECGVRAGMPGCLVHNSDPHYPSFKNLMEFAQYVLKQK